MKRQEMAALIDLALQKLQSSKEVPLPIPPTTTVIGHYNGTTVPKGVTIVVKHPDGTPARTTQVVDVLNPTTNSNNLLYDPASATYRLGNIPLIFIRNDGDPSKDELYKQLTDKANTAARLFAQLTFVMDGKGTITLRLPSTAGTGLVWKYIDFTKKDWPIALVPGDSLTLDLHLEQADVWVYLDDDPGKNPNTIVREAGRIMLKNTGTPDKFSLRAMYGTIDIN